MGCNESHPVAVADAASPSSRHPSVAVSTSARSQRQTPAATGAGDGGGTSTAHDGNVHQPAQPPPQAQQAQNVQPQPPPLRDALQLEESLVELLPVDRVLRSPGPPNDESSGATPATDQNPSMYSSLSSRRLLSGGPQLCL